MASPESTLPFSLEPAFLRRLESLTLRSQKLAAGSQRGERKSSRVGSGIAFATHRAYAPGDDFRFVDWQAYARSERLYVKQHEEERDRSLYLLLDCSASMAQHEGSKLAYAKQLAAALGYLSLHDLDRVSVQPYASEPLAPLMPLRGRRQALLLLRYLAALEAGGSTNLRAAAQAVAVRAPAFSMAIVLSDGFDPAGLLMGVDQLRYARLEPVVLLIRDPREAAPALRGELELVDSESGAARTFMLGPRQLERYRQAYGAEVAALHEELVRRRVPAHALSVSLPLEHAVLDLLRRGGLVSR